MEVVITWVSIVIAVFALFVAFKSLGASRDAVRASLYEQRFEIYSDTAQFIAVWMQKATPDIDNELRRLIGAWSRSQFLFDKKVTDHIRLIWIDAIEANMANEIMQGNVEGDYQEAVKTKWALLKKHTLDEQDLRKVFSSLAVKT